MSFVEILGWNVGSVLSVRYALGDSPTRARAPRRRFPALKWLGFLLDLVFFLCLFFLFCLFLTRYDDIRFIYLVADWCMGPCPYYICGHFSVSYTCGIPANTMRVRSEHYWFLVVLTSYGDDERSGDGLTFALRALVKPS